MENTYTIRSTSDLEYLLTNTSIKYQYDTLSVSSKSSEFQHQVKKLNRYYFACGCNSGAIALLVIVFGGNALLAFNGWWSFGYLLLSLFAGFMGSISAKLISLVIAKTLSRKIIRNLIKNFSKYDLL